MLINARETATCLGSIISSHRIKRHDPLSSRQPLSLFHNSKSSTSSTRQRSLHSSMYTRLGIPIHAFQSIHCSPCRQSPVNPSIVTDDAAASGFQRQVQSCLVFHGNHREESRCQKIDGKLLLGTKNAVMRHAEKRQKIQYPQLRCPS